MNVSLIYRSARVYDLTMWALYGRAHQARLLAVAGLVPDGASVLEVCCGPGFLYERGLRARGVRYTGLDINPAFVRRVERLGGRGIVHDVADSAALPLADYVIIQAALYQFLPNTAAVVGRMLAAAGTGVVVAEPVRNLATAGLPVLSRLARLATDAGRGATPLRFNEPSLDDFIATVPARLRRSFLVPGGREKVYLLDTDSESSAPEISSTERPAQPREESQRL